MKNRKSIFTALMAFLVLMMGVNFNAEAQLGGLLNKAKEKVSGGGKTKERKKDDIEKEAKEKFAAQQAMFQLAIPQPDAGKKVCIFSIGGTGICSWNPATLELTITTNRGGNTPGSVYKLDPATGKFTDKNGAPKGSISADGTIESPNLGTLKLTETVIKGQSVRFEEFVEVPESVMAPWFYADRIVSYKVEGTVNGKNGSLGSVTLNKAITVIDNVVVSSEVNPLLMAYVAHGLMLTEKEIIVKSLGFDPDKTYTTEELEDMIEWNDKESIDKIIKYESSLPCAGFKDTHPEFKNCKVAAVGLRSNEWREVKETDSYGYANWFYVMNYWVVYELADGRNIVTFSTAREKSKYGDVISKAQTKTGDFHEVTDWKRE